MNFIINSKLFIKFAQTHQTTQIKIYNQHQKEKISFHQINNFMLSKITGLLSKNVFFVSRQKQLLRRRKHMSKKQKVAKKKFLQHNPNGSYAHELKILQIQKQLDKKVSKNHNLNELMDELFYPDVRYANQKLIQENLLKISINPEENKKKRKSKNTENGEIIEQQNDEFDELLQQIYLCQIPSQLFGLYLKNSQLFAQHHLTIFMQKLEFYFKNKQIIQERVTEKWKQSLQKLKLTDTQKKKRKRCPYIFIEQDELIRDQDWNKIVKDINKKIVLSTEHISNQLNQENQESDELEPLDESFYLLQNNCDLAIQIKIAGNYLPEQIFESIVKKAFAIINLERIDDKSDERLPIFSHSEKVKLLAVLGLKSATKSTFTRPVHIELPEASYKQEQKIKQLGKKLCEDILKSNECTAEDLGTIILSDRSHYNFLDYSLLELAKGNIFKFLAKTSFQRSIDYIRAFWQNGEMKDSDFIQVLMFDIYRKLPYSVSKHHLFDFISYIQDWVLIFRESKVQIRVSEIYPRIAEGISKYLNQNTLNHGEIQTLMTSIYQNYPFYKAESRGNILELLATAVVKMGEGFKLEELTQLYFRTTVMGHRSKIFSKYVFERYQKEYKNLMRQYKSEKVQLITDKNKKPSDNNTNESDPTDSPSMKEVVLEENLLMMFWCYVINLNAQNASLPLSDMIELFPLYIYSHDSMIEDLRTDLNIHLKEYNFFPEIKNKTFNTNSKKQPKQSDQDGPFLIKTNTSLTFSYKYNESIATEIMEKLQNRKEPIQNAVFEDLAFYLMKYSLFKDMQKSDIKLPQRWNYTVRTIFNHRTQEFDNLQNLFMKSYENIDRSSVPMIASKLMLVLKQRNKTSRTRSVETKTNDSAQKPYKLYQLL